MTTNLGDLLVQCRYPDVPEHYLVALKKAVQHILQEYDVLGIIAAGSIIRGVAHASSDWDIYVIQAKPQRQMMQRFFGGVPTQIFLNPPHMIHQYFESESAEGICITAHMLVTGFVVLDRDPFIETIRQEAREVLARGPQIGDELLTMRRYHIASEFENALDVLEGDPTTTVLVLGEVLMDMLRFYFLRHNTFIPRNKDLLGRVREHNAELGGLVHDFYVAGDVEQKVATAQAIADRTIEAYGFFECQTPLETLKFPSE